MKCRLCNSKDIKTFTVESRYYYCNNCELIFIDSSNFSSESKEHQSYLQHENTPQNEGYVNMFKDFIEQLIEEYVDEINTVLEYGCGPGPVLADLLEDRGLKVKKYDPFFYPEQNFLEHKYDLITSTEVFEHFQDPKKEVQKLVNLMKTGSYLAVMTSFHQGIEHFKNWWYRRDLTHIAFYNLNTFKYIEKEYPLQIIKTNNENNILLKKR